MIDYNTETDAPGPPPNMPDFARFIPLDAIDMANNQDMADEWIKPHQANISDQWAKLQYQNLDDMLAQKLVEPVLSSTSIEGQNDYTNIPLAQSTAQQPEPVTSDNIGKHLLDVLRQAVGAGAQTAGLSSVAPEKPPESVGEAAVGAAQAEINRTKQLFTPSGLSLYNPNTPTPFGAGEAEAPAARMATGAGKETGPLARAAAGAGSEIETLVSQAGDPRAQTLMRQIISRGHGDPQEILRIRDAVVDATPDMDLRGKPSALAEAAQYKSVEQLTKLASGDVEGAAPETIKRAQDVLAVLKGGASQGMESAPRVGQVAEYIVDKGRELFGERRIAAAKKILDDDAIIQKLIDKFYRQKKTIEDFPGSRAERDALGLWKANRMVGLSEAIVANDAKKAAQSVVEIARTEGLPELGAAVKPVAEPDMAAIDAAMKADPGIGQQVVRAVARDVTAGGPTAEEVAQYAAAGAARRAGVASRKALMPIARQVNREAASLGAEAGRAGPTPVRDVRAGEPTDIHVPRPPGGLGNPPPPGRGFPLGPGAAQIAGGVAGGIIGAQFIEDDDDLMMRILKVGIGAGMGASAARIPFGPGGQKGVGERAQTTYITGLIGPRATVASAPQDISNVLLDAPTLRFAEATMKYGPKAGAQEAAAMLKALADGDAVKRGLMQALHEFDPRVSGDVMYRGEKIGSGANEAAGVGQYASTLGTRPLNAWTVFIKEIMLAQEKAALREGGTVRLLRGEPLIGDVAQSIENLSMEQVQRRLFMGEAEGGLGRAGQYLGKGARAIPGLGPLLQPFVTIPANFMDKTASAIPVAGLLNMIGAKNKSAVVARNIQGGVATAAVAGLMAATGSQITGGGPAGQSENKAWRDQGYQPYAVKVRGSTKWVKVDNLPPVLKAGLLFLGSWDDVSRYGVSPEQMGRTATAFGHSLGATDFVPTLARFVLGDLPVAQQAQSQIASFFPWYSRQTAQAMRPTVPETKGAESLPPGAKMPERLAAAAEAGVVNAFPGNAPARQTQAGETVPQANEGVLGILSPFRATEQVDSRVIDTLGKVGVFIPDPPDTIPVGTSKQIVELSGAEKRLFQRARGEFLNKSLPKTLAGKDDADKLLAAAHKFASAEVLKGIDVKARGRVSKELKAEATQNKARTWADIKAGQPAATATPSAEPAQKRTWADLKSKPVPTRTVLKTVHRDESGRIAAVTEHTFGQ